MFGLTPLGTFHTAISLIAVAAGLIAFIRYKQISPKNLVGKIYVITCGAPTVVNLTSSHRGSR